jgi:2-methylcitrate dehydratase PrpD
MQHPINDDVPSTESARFAQFALGLTPEAVPADVRALAKRHFLDALGIAIGSTGFDFGRIALRGVRELGEGGRSTAIGTGTPLPSASAALLNGILAHGLDFDDTHIAGIYHASAPAIAASLAAGQANGATGEEVLLAFIVGIEIGCRLAVAGAGEFTRRGFHSTAVCGTFAAAAAAARLTGADRATLVQAFGLSGSMASGVLETGSSWLKRLHPGWSAHSGVSAVALARAGFVGPETMFEGARGFYSTHIGRVPSGDTSPTYELGQTWQARGIALKPYPCCHVLHAHVDAALELRDKFSIDEIERIECPLVGEWHRLIAEPRADCVRPANPYRALFSVQYVVGLAIARGRVDLASFYDEPLDGADVLSVADKTWVVDDPLSDYPAHFPGEVIVTLKNGSVFRSRKAASLGTPEVPLPMAALEAKFMSNATRVIGHAAAERLIASVMKLETLESVEEVMALTVPA